MTISHKKTTGRTQHRTVRTARRSAPVASGYSNYGASTSKNSLMGWMFGGGSPREDVDPHLKTLRPRARDLYMGVPIATSALKTLRTNMVGSGLQLKPMPDAEVLGITQEEASAKSREIVREWKLWAHTVECDLSRQNTFAELQQLAGLAWPMSGDVFATLPVVPRPHSVYDLRVKMIEADRVCNPNSSGLLGIGQTVMRAANGNFISEGVEYTPGGEVVAFHIAQKHPLSSQFNGGGLTNTWERVEVFGARTGRRNIVHLFNAERPEQYRGVPLLAPVIETIKQLGRYTDAELVAAVVSGMFTAFIKSNTPQSPMGGYNPNTEGQQPRVIHVGRQDDVELGNGTVMGLALDEDIEFANPGRPNTAFDGFVLALSRFIGAALEIPSEVLLKSFMASYSASRAALLEFWKMCRMFRAWLASDFCQPIYVEWLTEAVALGRIDLPGFFTDPTIKAAWCNAVWNGPAPGHIQPLVEATAAEKRMQLGISSGDQEAMEANGTSIEDNLRQLGEENRLRQKHGLPPLGAGLTDISPQEMAAMVAE